MKRIAVLLLVLAACGGGGDSKTSTGDSASAGKTSTTTTTVAAGATATTAVAGETTTTAAGATATHTTAAAGAPAAAPAPATDSGPAPLPPGTYHYKQTGSAKAGGQSYDSPPEGKAVADAAGGDGKQVVHRYIDPNGEANDTTLRFGPDGIFILETVLRMGETEITCTFDPPLAAPAWPPVVGAKAAGHGTCGAFTTDVRSEITEARNVSLDGKTYDAVVVKSTITTSGQVESTSHQLDWFVPELRLSAHTESDSKGTFGTFAFESSGTADLLSAMPS